MKHHLSLLIAALLAIGGPLAFAVEANASPSLEKILTEAKAAFDLARDLDRVSQIDPATFALEAEVGPVELAFLPIEPAPVRIEKASCRVPQIRIVSGYQRHAWLAAYRMPTATVSNDPLGLNWRGPRCYDRLT
jgi:hypothetical protein